MSAVAEAFSVTRQHLIILRNRPPPPLRGRSPLPDAELVTDIYMLVTELPTYRYRREPALLRRQAEATVRSAYPKRVYRVMIVRGLLLQRNSEQIDD